MKTRLKSLNMATYIVT